MLHAKPYGSAQCEFVKAAPNRWGHTIVSDFVYIASGNCLHINSEYI